MYSKAYRPERLRSVYRTVIWLTMTNVKICGWSGQKLKEGPKGVGD
jgi:hypothetical protein